MSRPSKPKLSLPSPLAPLGPPDVPIDRVGSPAQVVSIGAVNVRCQTCRMREQCLHRGLTFDEMQQIDALITRRSKVMKHGTLYRAGQPFLALYAIRMGSLKTVVRTDDGREQVADFHIFGDIIGYDGVANESYGVDAIALEDSEVCALPFAGIEKLARSLPGLHHNLHKSMSRQLVRDQGTMFMLGSMSADERLINFLLSLADRYHRLGYSRTEFTLRMSRKEISSHLGLKFETVSRAFSRLHDEGLVHVRGRSLKFVDPVAMKKIVARDG